MTLAERLEARGREEGRAQGRTEGRAAVLIEQMTDRFGTLPGDTIQRIRSASLDQLRAWNKRVLRAQTIEEIFA
ncbi:DUF4351 domain-containing protein [Nocardia sp. BMG51109]|uniref:DUF4351 domain-containing protein n=1 Tax=Nocardia sp. BMG51109 TaxID=1056816 RepID=UPI000562519B|nr:DUF4351 domain-containing protein [Nocardia sp. BMG51109]